MMADYEYVRRQYGVAPVVGERVRHTEINKQGTIAKPSETHGHYVQVRFDGQKHASNCHPTSLEYFGAAEP